MPHKLLLADDSVTIQRVIELTFADENIQVTAVSDGDQAIARIDANPPDIVLADIGMPGKNGYEVAAHVKRTPGLAHIPVILLTGAFEPVDQVRADAAGCDGVLAKPFEPQLVISRVKELLARPGRPPVSLDAALAPPAAAPAGPWKLGTVADPPAAVPKQPPAKTGGDDYFDRLDAAFANLSTGGSEPAKPPAPAPGSNPIAESIDWFAPTAKAPPADLPLSYGSPRTDFAAPPEAPRGRVQQAPAAPAQPPRQVLPPLADAFAALLAAEQSAPAPAAAQPQWPAPPPAPSVVERPAMTEEVMQDVIQEVTRRVLEQLSDQVVRETVREIVTAVAERMVAAEIERIKSTIR